jgi:hypothetical protein
LYLYPCKNREDEQISWVALEKKHTAKAHNNFGIFKPVILHEGRVVGNWKASIDKQGENLTIDFFADKSKIGK